MVLPLTKNIDVYPLILIAWSNASSSLSTVFGILLTRSQITVLPSDFLLRFDACHKQLEILVMKCSRDVLLQLSGSSSVAPAMATGVNTIN